MQKYLVLVVAFLFFSNSYSQKSKQIKLKADHNKFEVKALKNTGFTVENSIADLNLKSVHSDEGDYVILESQGLIKTFNIGMPNIPVVSKLMEVPQNAEVKLIVKSFDEEIIKLSDYAISNKILPALRTQFKSENSVPFVLNESIYNKDDYFNTEIAVYEEVGQMRATRIGRLEINPIQYNPVQNTLRVLNNLEIEVQFINADYAKTETLKKKYNTVYFNSLLSGTIINTPSNSKELITQAPTHMVIVADPMFESQLAPFIEWKVKKGFKITEAYTDVIGATTTEIKAYLQAIYEGSDPMSFVLFVGDVQQIPAWNGNAGSHVTDLRYCEYTGDNLPDVYYGRFSAQNTAQLQPQIDKTMMYEQFTMSDPSYLSEVFLVAGDDSSHEMTWGNGQIWYGDNYYFNATNNVNAHTYLQPLDNGAVHTIIINDMNAGLAFANYTAHCGPSGWASPSFSTSDVNSLTNDEKYGVWIGNCCLSVKFDENECFGEAALRKANGGAIGDIGGSNSTTWDEDYWWGVGLTSSIVAEPTYEDSGEGAYDGVWHNLANETSDPTTWFPTQGQIQVCGNLAVESSTSSSKEYYWEIYHLMGDPSVTNYIGTPQAMTVTPSPGALLIGMSSLTVTSAPYAYVALSQDGSLLAAAVADSAGSATLNFDGGALNVGSADLVVTCQNKIPSIGTITVSPADTPYIILNSYTTSAPADYGETIGLNVTLENVATAGSGNDASGVVATLSTTDTFVTINDGTENYGTINAGTNLTIDNAFNITIADNAPDQHVVTFDLSITDDASHIWNTTLNLTLNAPLISIGNLTIDDTATGNGDSILDPGETATLTIQATNEGHADVTNVISVISSTSTDLTINTATAPTTSLNEGATGNFEFSVTADAATAPGTPANLTNDITAGISNQYDAQKEFTIIIGFVPEYCSAGSNNSNDEFIQQVVFEDIDNTSTIGASYTDYTNISTDVEVGNTYPITIINGHSYSSDQMGCWVDWNYDGDFEDLGEYFVIDYAHDTPSSDLGTGTGSVIVPADARLGVTTMRLRVLWNGDILPCGNASYGEVEDYSINVTNTHIGVDDNNLSNINIYPNPNAGSFTVDLRKINSSNEVNIELYNISGQLIYQNIASQKLFKIDTDEKAGVYFLRMTSGNQVINKKIIISK